MRLFTQKEVAKIFGISYERVRRIRNNMELSYKHKNKTEYKRDYIRKEFRKTLWTYDGLLTLYKRLSSNKNSKLYKKLNQNQNEEN